MSYRNVVFLLLTVFALSVGQVLFKLAALQMHDGQGLVQRFLFNPYMVAACFVYGCATLVWVSLLRQVPLHLAYPFVAVAFLFVPLIGYGVLKEPIRASTIVGAFIIILGVWISVRSDY